MATSDSSWKWILGCGGLAVLLVLALCGVGAYFLPSAITGVQGMIAEEAKRIAFAQAWQPPADNVPANELFPDTVSEYKVVNRDPDPIASKFGIDLPGQHGKYSSSGAELDVFVFRTSQLEKEALFNRIEEATDDASYNSRTRFTTMNGDQLRFSVRPPPTDGLLWWSKGWLFVFFTKNGHEPESFQQAYLKQIQGLAVDGGETKVDQD